MKTSSSIGLSLPISTESLLVVILAGCTRIALFSICEHFSINTLDRDAATGGREKAANLRRLVGKAFENSVNGVAVISNCFVTTGGKPA